MKCLNCDNKAVGRSKYCSETCKVLYNRKQSKTVNTPNAVPLSVIPNGEDMTIDSKGDLRPAYFGLPNCECKHCQQNRTNGNGHIINHGPVKTFNKLAKNELNRVSLPGDVDYEGVADTAQAVED